MIVDSVKKGLLLGLNTTWSLGKVIFPVTLIVTVLQYTPVLPFIINLIAPLMNLIGLPGDAAIPLVLGNFLNLYAAIAGILTLDLTVKEVFIIAMMLSFSHNLLIESGVAMKTGVKLWVILTVRIGLALLSAVVINLVWQGGSEMAQGTAIGEAAAEINGTGAILLHGVIQALSGIGQLAVIVIPLMVAVQIMKDLKWLEAFSKSLAPFMKVLGMKPNASMPFVTGLTLGLAYGAGVMIQAAKEDNVSKKDMTIAFIFLVACHAVVEDTLIFIPLGIPVLPLLLIRLLTAIVLTMVVAYIWNRTDRVQRKEAVYEQ
ncbi:nucleoside recognition domain-containing protein [Peribacillus frigoritolerans]|uniref:nucleoside recognition domain-containing protein n=1 Tax=Peribacillus frigoritolerans TaxID=450367 RepID=UPI0022260125|nr:nucleoside recognition domain-containing protein [Peribacillus frigoritolerans]UYY98769.1 nucleoside recognition domain-containing protein [Peribacillus frigoritolerans]